jgi:hypothetical protein
MLFREIIAVIVVIAVTMVMLLRYLGLMTLCCLVCDHLLLRDFRPYGIIFMTVSFYFFRFSRRS